MLRVLPILGDFRVGLSDPLNNLLPSSQIFSAAFSSRANVSPHSQTHIRSPRSRAVLTTPQAACNLLEGNQRSIFCTVLPRHLLLYSSCRTKSLRAASPKDLPRLPRAIPLTFKSSSITASYSLTTRLESWCSQLARRFAIRLWIRDTTSLAFARRFEPFTQRLSFFCALASLASYSRKNLGGATS